MARDGGCAIDGAYSCNTIPWSPMIINEPVSGEWDTYLERKRLIDGQYLRP